jgi:uncharacterized protein YjbI with pentapeptide repeats
MENKDAKKYDIAGAIMLEGNFAGVNFKEVTMSKVLAQKANFDGADFSNAVSRHTLDTRSTQAQTSLTR